LRLEINKTESLYQLVVFSSICQDWDSNLDLGDTAPLTPRQNLDAYDRSVLMGLFVNIVVVFALVSMASIVAIVATAALRSSVVAVHHRDAVIHRWLSHP
jgi:hypothetical protein